MLTLEAVKFELGSFRLAADFSVKTGERVAMIGPSGAGKSTLLDVIAGFQKPTTGRVLWDRSDMDTLPPGDRPMSILFQDGNLFPHLTVAENVGLGVRPSLRLSETEQARVEAVLKRVGLAGLGLRKPAALSGGQRGRVALARVLLMARPLVLLDEPFTALGPALRSDMLALLEEVLDATGASLMMATHDPEDARRVAGAAVLVADGVAEPPVPMAEFLANPPEALRAYLGDGRFTAPN